MIFLLLLILILAYLLIRAKQKIQLIRHHNPDFDMYQQAARIGSWEWDIEKQTTHISSTALDIFGFNTNLNHISDTNFRSYIYELDKKAYICALKDALNNKTPFVGEFRCDLKSPFKKWFTCLGQVITGTNNQPVKVIGMLYDITKTVISRKIHQAMTDILNNIVEYEQLENILSEICTAIGEVEPSIQCVIFISKKDSTKLELHHCPEIKLPLKHILNSISSVDPESEVFQTLKQKNIIKIQHLNDLPSWQSANQVYNKLNLESFYGQPLSINEKEIQGVLGLYLEDCTIPEKIVHQILEMASGVISVAIESQLQADNKQKIQLQLYHSQKMDSLGHLTGGIAHDFNNILGSIVGYNSLSRKIAIKNEDEQLIKFLNEVSNAAERARDLISQMMIFSRSEPSKNISVQIQPVIKEVLQLVRSMIPSSITISHCFEEDLSNIKINPIGLHQIILNLLINAKDAISSQVGNITVNVYRHQQKSNRCLSCHDYFEGDFICLEITDSGSGIPSELLERIFEPFFTTKEIGRGTGMGLSVVHGITHEVNAHICGSSAPDLGTSIRIYFPPIDGDSTNEVQGQLLKSEANVPIGNGENIMVVDDDIPLGLLFEEILIAYGYQVNRFDNSQIAFEAFVNEPDKFSLILSDQTMPFMTGDELSRKILSKRKNIPIIICTGYSEILNNDEAKKIGIKAILDKPVDMYKLLYLVEETIKQSS